MIALLAAELAGAVGVLLMLAIVVQLDMDRYRPAGSDRANWALDLAEVRQLEADEARAAAVVGALYAPAAGVMGRPPRALVGVR